MADMSKYSKKPTPGQMEHRRQWIIDTVRANQDDVGELFCLLFAGLHGDAKDVLSMLHRTDRDAILQPNGILTPAQIEALK